MLCGAPHNREVTVGFTAETCAGFYAGMSSVAATGRLYGLNPLAAVRRVLAGQPVILRAAASPPGRG